MWSPKYVHVLVIWNLNETSQRMRWMKPTADGLHPRRSETDSLDIAGVHSARVLKLIDGCWMWLTMMSNYISNMFQFFFRSECFGHVIFPQEISLTWQCYHPHQRNTGLVKTGANAGTNTGQAQCCPQSLSKIDLSRFLWGRFQPLSLLGLYSISSDATYQVQPDPKKESKATDGISSAGIAENYWPVVSTCKSCNWAVFSKNLYLGPFIFSSCAMLGDCTCITTFDHFPA